MGGDVRHPDAGDPPFLLAHSRVTQMVPGVMIVGHFQAHIAEELIKAGVQIVEPQETAAKIIARGMLDVQAKQIGKGYGKETRTPWFRKFEKRGRYGR